MNGIAPPAATSQGLLLLRVAMGESEQQVALLFQSHYISSVKTNNNWNIWKPIM